MLMMMRVLFRLHLCQQAPQFVQHHCKRKRSPQCYYYYFRCFLTVQAFFCEGFKLWYFHPHKHQMSQIINWNLFHSYLNTCQPHDGSTWGEDSDSFTSCRWSLEAIIVPAGVDQMYQCVRTVLRKRFYKFLFVHFLIDYLHWTPWKKQEHKWVCEWASHWLSEWANSCYPALRSGTLFIWILSALASGVCKAQPACQMHNVRTCTTKTT